MGKTTEDDVMTWLRSAADEEHRAGLARYGIPVGPALGVPMGDLKKAAKRFGPAHHIVSSLWETEVYEARVMAIHLADPSEFSRRDADRWSADFDNWALCDTAAFHLFDRTSWAWDAVGDWSADPREFVRRAAFATLWGLSVHDKRASNEQLLSIFPRAASAAKDERLYVKKAVDMALRAVGKRNAVLNLAVCDIAQDFASSENKTTQWIGRHVLKELESLRVRQKLGLI